MSENETSQSLGRRLRNDIFDALRIDNVFFGGQLGDVDFLSRLYDLKKLPSYDSRFYDAAGDIVQHRVNNFDWPDDWVFGDSRFDLLGCSDEQFLKFLSEMVHPVVRPDSEEAANIVATLNALLEAAGWQLKPHKEIAGRAIYEPTRRDDFSSQIKRAATAAEVLSSNWMQTEIARIQSAIDSDPALAVGTAKDLIESCCKSIISELDGPHAIGKKDDLPTLTKKMLGLLALMPDDIPDKTKGSDTIKRTLNNLSSISKSIAELRSLYGSGHGRDGKHTGLEPRHARLAASCAIAFVDFATETYFKRHKV